MLEIVALLLLGAVVGFTGLFLHVLLGRDPNR
jgi:hypothetical protein